MNNSQVLVVGAGPTGLVLALWLARAGVPVRIVDKTDRPGTTSRALVLHARNIEFYHQLGIDRLVIDQGIQFEAINLWRSGVRVGRVEIGSLGATISPYPYILAYPQDAHEQMLVEQLGGLGIRVERGTELVDFKTEGDGIDAELLTHSGDRQTCRAAYLAGCDGAHSTVREKLGVGFTGGDYADTFYVADINGNGPVFDGDMHVALDDSDFLAVFPMKGDGRARLVGAIRGSGHDPRQLHWEDVSQGIFRRAKMTVANVNWFSTYRVHHRVASHFRAGPVFLLGDAAHVHSPVGGQGMNTGIGDAINLAWKLAAVLKGAAPSALLDTYEPERIAFARKLVATTDRAFEFISARGPIATRVRLGLAPVLLPPLARIQRFRRFLFRTVSQTAIKYPQSRLSAGRAGSIRGGDRLPWVQLPGEPGRAADNFAPLVSREWQVHVYGDGAPALREACDKRGVPLHIFPWCHAARQAGLKENAAYVVRPDGYVGLADPDADAAKISAYLDAWVPHRRA